MNIKTASSDIIVVKETEKRTTSMGGIALPENCQKETNSDKIGIVTDIGSDINCVEIGDTIAFSHNYANVVNLGNKVRIFIKAENLLAILE
jgi:co-chaperonin GroES (HSP10)